MSVGYFHIFGRRNSEVAGRSSWLQSSIDGIEKKIEEAVAEDTSAGSTFAERAELYYRKHPQLIALLTDLYRCYLSLADQYCRLKAHPAQPQFEINGSPQIKPKYNSDTEFTHTDQDGELEGGILDSESDHDPHQDSDCGSNISCQTSDCSSNEIQLQDSSSENIDELFVETVSSTIEKDLVLHELVMLQDFNKDALRKIDLQGSLLEVLESERLILLSENDKLELQLAEANEENKRLISDVMFFKRKANELGSCLMKVRSNHQVCVLHQRIEDLQQQIFCLEKRNKEYYDRLVGKESERKEKVREFCMEMERLRVENFSLKEALSVRDGSASSTSTTLSGWLDKVKKVKFFSCARS